MEIFAGLHAIWQNWQWSYDVEERERVSFVCVCDSICAHFHLYLIILHNAIKTDDAKMFTC